MFSPTLNVTKTFNFAPAVSEIVLAAFSRNQIRPAEIDQNKMLMARMSVNLLLSEWANMQPNLWEVGLQVMPLQQGVGTYSMPAETVMILDLYISYGSPPLDRYIYPISRTEYASYPTKLQQSFPTVYWYDRQISQEITFWPVPDGAQSYVAKFYTTRQTFDADVKNDLNVEIPYRFFEAYVAGLAWKLSEHYAPQLEDKLFARYQRAFSIATTQDVENTSLFITPGLTGYFRQ